jgi:deazaflavin-dependent oxidoreductase (nitroreductase family)
MKMALKAQVFLLRRNWMGPAGKVLMVITTIGRKTGHQHSIPIGYQWDGDTLLAFTRGGHSNWYKNMLKNPQVTLTIQGKQQVMRGEKLEDQTEILRALEIYKREQPNIVQRFFGVSPEASGAELLKATDRVVLVRFRPAK